MLQITVTIRCSAAARRVEPATCPYGGRNRVGRTHGPGRRGRGAEVGVDGGGVDAVRLQVAHVVGPGVQPLALIDPRHQTEGAERRADDAQHQIASGHHHTCRIGTLHR